MYSPSNPKTLQEMEVDPLGTKALEDSETAFGIFANYPKEIELAAYLGFDYVIIDQMFTSNGWQKTGHLIRAAGGADITPVVRTPAYPWADGSDRNLVVSAARNMGIGAKYLTFSYSSLDEVEDCTHLVHDPHRKTHLVNKMHEPGPEDAEPDIFLVPSPETAGALEVMEDVLSIPEVRMFSLSMGDLSPVVTDTDNPDFTEPELWDFIDEVVELGEKYDTVIWANPSRHASTSASTPYSPYPTEELIDRVVRLQEHGVPVITVQSFDTILKMSLGNVMSEIKQRID